MFIGRMTSFKMAEKIPRNLWTLQRFIDSVFCWMTSSSGSIFRVTGHLCGEFTGPPVNSPHKGQWRGALMFSLICVWINGWVNNRKAGDLRCYRSHYDVIVISHSAPWDVSSWLYILLSQDLIQKRCNKRQDGDITLCKKVIVKFNFLSWYHVQYVVWSQWYFFVLFLWSDHSGFTISTHQRRASSLVQVMACCPFGN